MFALFFVCLKTCIILRLLGLLNVLELLVVA